MQALADFIFEFTIRDKEEGMALEVETCWKLFVDGAANNFCSGARVVLETPEGRSVCYALHFEFPATNNEAEYEALIAGLKIVKELETKFIHIYSDSQLVVCQVKGQYQARGENLAPDLSKVQKLLKDIEHYTITHIPREYNTKVDYLAKLASYGEAQSLRLVPVETLITPSISEMDTEWIFEKAKEPKTWMMPIKDYMLTGTLPTDRNQWKKLI